MRLSTVYRPFIFLMQVSKSCTLTILLLDLIFVHFQNFTTDIQHCISQCSPEKDNQEDLKSKIKRFTIKAWLTRWWSLGSPMTFGWSAGEPGELMGYAPLWILAGLRPKKSWWSVWVQRKEKTEVSQAARFPSTSAFLFYSSFQLIHKAHPCFHGREGNLLFSFYWFKCSVHPQHPHRHSQTFWPNDWAPGSPRQVDTLP